MTSCRSARGRPMVCSWLLLAASLLQGCALRPNPNEACGVGVMLERSDAAAVQAYWVQVESWPAERFANECLAVTDARPLTAAERIGLAVVYAAPVNPKRSQEQVHRLLSGLSPDVPAEVVVASRLVTTVTDRQFADEQKLLASKNREQELAVANVQLEQASRQGVSNGERAEIEARRAREANRRAQMAEERLRDSQRRLAETSLQLTEATRRLDALKSVEEAMSVRLTVRRRAAMAASAPAAPLPAAPALPVPQGDGASAPSDNPAK